MFVFLEWVKGVRYIPHLPSSMYVQWLPTDHKGGWGGLVPQCPCCLFQWRFVCRSRTVFFFWLFLFVFWKEGSKRRLACAVSVSQQTTNNKPKRRWTVPDPPLEKSRNWCFILPVCTFSCICHGLRCLALDHWTHKSAFGVRQKGKGSPNTSSKRARSNRDQIYALIHHILPRHLYEHEIRTWTRQHPPSATEW